MLSLPRGECKFSGYVGKTLRLEFAEISIEQGAQVSVGLHLIHPQLTQRPRNRPSKTRHSRNRRQVTELHRRRDAANQSLATDRRNRRQTRSAKSRLGQNTSQIPKADG